MLLFSPNPTHIHTFISLPLLRHRKRTTKDRWQGNSPPEGHLQLEGMMWEWVTKGHKQVSLTRP